MVWYATKEKRKWYGEERTYYSPRKERRNAKQQYWKPKKGKKEKKVFDDKEFSNDFRKGGLSNREFSSSRSMPYLMPDKIYVKLDYDTAYEQTVSSGSPWNHLFRGNSLFDPDYTGTGNQPIGFVQWSALYKNYTVYGSRITIDIQLSETFVDWEHMTFEYIVFPETVGSTVTSGNFRRYAEQKYCKRGFANYQKGGYKLTNYMTTAKIFGRNPSAITAEQNYTGSSTSNPLIEWWWNIAVRDVKPTGSVPIIVRAKITYYAEMSNNPALTQS